MLRRPGPAPPRGRLRPGRRRRRGLTRRLRHVGATAGPTDPPGRGTLPGRKHGSPRWIVEDGRVLGGIALRHIFDDDIGHIRYGVRPSARRRGLAGWALGEMLG